VNRYAPEDRWQRFAAAARQGTVVVPSQAPDSGQSAPVGFVARVVAQAMQARREFLALLWERWSWRVALVTAAVAATLGFLVVQHGHQPRLDVPSISLEVPPLESP